MSHETSDLFVDFFSLKTPAQLKTFLADLDTRSEMEIALLYFAQTWFEDPLFEELPTFRPENFLSPDLSSIVFGKCPVIFLGTNNWALKPYYPKSDFRRIMENFYYHLRKMRENLRNIPITMIMVPEKDFVIDRLFQNSGRYGVLKELASEMVEKAATFGIQMIFDEPLHRMEEFQSLQEFRFPDSHLLGRNYIQTFALAIQNLGLHWAELKPRISMRQSNEYGDLDAKLSGGNARPHATQLPLYIDEAIVLRDGEPTYCDPLRETWQHLTNSNAQIAANVLILGDSHSSIVGQKRLTYLAAGAFEECKFFWNPAGLHGEPTNYKADYVILEISQRFLF